MVSQPFNLTRPRAAHLSSGSQGGPHGGKNKGSLKDFFWRILTIKLHHISIKQCNNGTKRLWSRIFWLYCFIVIQQIIYIRKYLTSRAAQKCLAGRGLESPYALTYTAVEPLMKKERWYEETLKTRITIFTHFISLLNNLILGLILLWFLKRAAQMASWATCGPRASGCKAPKFWTLPEMIMCKCQTWIKIYILIGL